MTKNEIIQTMLNEDIDKLYIEIGTQVSPAAIMPRPTQKIIEIGKEWLSQKKASFKQVICENEQVINLMQNEHSNDKKILLVTAIADLISGICIGVSPFTVSVLLVQLGIDTLCKS